MEFFVLSRAKKNEQVLAGAPVFRFRGPFFQQHTVEVVGKIISKSEIGGVLFIPIFLSDGESVCVCRVRWVIKMLGVHLRGYEDYRPRIYSTVERSTGGLPSKDLFYVCTENF